jgi:hypothetical protein
LPVRSLAAEPGDPGRQRPDALRLRRRRCLPYSRAGAGTLVFSKEAPDLLYGIGDCLAKLGALPETLVWDREGALHAGGGRPTEPFAAFCGELRVGWRFLEPRDPQSKGYRYSDWAAVEQAREARGPRRLEDGGR